MTPAEIQSALQAGREAIKRGQRTRARELLLQVVEADEGNETAWLWLSVVVESLDDQITALENVLQINPQNQAAQKGLAQLRLKLAAGEAPQSAAGDSLGPEPDEQQAAAEFHPEAEAARLESVSALDDPDQCVYCGAPAAPELRRCPECKRSLMETRGKPKPSPALRGAAFALMANLAISALGAIAIVMFHYQGGPGRLVTYIYTTLNLQILFGDFTQWPPDLTYIVMWICIGVVVTMVGLTLGLLYQFTLAYYASVGFLVLNMLWIAYRWLAGFSGPILAVADVLASFFSLFFIFAAQPDFAVNAFRLRCRVDANIKGGDALNKLGHVHKRQGEWALAVAYWRAAAAAIPNQPDFYKDLAVGYAQIGYYDRALKALAEFARLSPGSADVAPMQKLIQAKRAQDSRPRG